MVDTFNEYLTEAPVVIDNVIKKLDIYISIILKDDRLKERESYIEKENILFFI